MKRFLSMAVVLVLLFGSAGCGKHGEGTGEHHDDGRKTTGENPISEVEPHLDPLMNRLEFASVEDFLRSYATAGEGEDIANFLSRWSAWRTDMSLADVVEITNFLALNKFYLPTGIPEPYQIYKIIVNEKSVTILFLHEAHLVSNDAIMAAIDILSFRFIFTRGWGFDSPMDGMLRQEGASKEDLIDDKYLFVERIPELIWAAGSELMHLYMPCRDERGEEIDVVEYFGLNGVEDLVKFTEMAVIDLTD